MEGGAAHWPLWLPYKLYGEVDHIYGWKAFHAKNGFTAAQGFLNVVETLMYAVYLWLWYSRSEVTAQGRVVTSRAGALAVLIGFSAAVMTLSKTILYCKSACSVILIARAHQEESQTVIMAWYKV